MLAYRAQLDRIIEAGAAGCPRRIFLVMPHDWGRSPRYVGNAQSDEMGQRTEVWNAFLAGTGARRVLHLVSLDLFTAMECVFSQPGDFGFTNVTQVRPQGADPAKYLFDLNDDIHFGQRGRTLIRQVVQYYLTRGWDWSNTDKNPATAPEAGRRPGGREGVCGHPRARPDARPGPGARHRASRRHLCGGPRRCHQALPDPGCAAGPLFQCRNHDAVLDAKKMIEGIVLGIS